MKYLIIPIIAFFLYLFSFIIDSATGDNFYKNNIVPSECDYILPPQYYLVKDSVSGEYAILYMHIDYYPHYLYVDRYSTIKNTIRQMGDTDEAMTFKDSCKAKGLAKMLYDQNSPKQKVFIKP